MVPYKTETPLKRKFAWSYSIPPYRRFTASNKQIQIVDFF